MKKIPLLLLISLSATGAWSRQGLTAAQVLSSARASVNQVAYRDAVSKGGIRLAGTADYLGLKGDYSLLLSMNDGFIEEVRTELPQVSAFDGKKAWATDYTGLPRILEGEDLETQQAFVWIFTPRWLEKDSPFTVVGDPKKNANGDVVIHLKLRDGLLEGDLVLDGKSYLPLTWTRPSDAGPDIWKFSNYKKSMGFSIARTLVNTTAGITNTVDISEVAKAPVFIRNPYEMPRARLADTTFDNSKPAELETKKAFSGHLLVHPTVNGQDLGWFIFDSGAGGIVIDTKVANDAKLAKLGKLPAVGVGGVVESAFRRASKISLGRVTIANPVFVDLDLSGISNAFGVKVAGIIGYDLLGRVVAEINWSKPSIAIFDPASYKLASGTWLELFLHDKNPVVKANFEGNREGLFRLDTGANNFVTFHEPVIAKYKLLEGRETGKSAMGGVGGYIEARVGTLEYFEFGGHRFEKPRVEFALAKTGAFANKYLAGNIGNAMLRPFTSLVFNYPEKKIAFVKGS